MKFSNNEHFSQKKYTAKDDFYGAILPYLPPPHPTPNLQVLAEFR